MPVTEPGAAARQPLRYTWLIFALTGFALAQPLYHLILAAPEFLVARQNTRIDTWLLAAVLSGLVPLILAMPGLLLSRKHPTAGTIYFVLVTFLFVTLFLAQLGNGYLGKSLLLFFTAVPALAAFCTWLITATPWRGLTPVLAVLSVFFPVIFLLQAPLLEDGDGAVLPHSGSEIPVTELPPIVFVIADELPVAALLDSDGLIDAQLFPNLYRLQQTASWYRNTITVADGTPEAVPSILTGRYPSTANTPATIANMPVNLFTLLQSQYRLNVAESVTRLCPRSQCPVDAPPGWNRFKALLLDLSAIYLHRVVPDHYSYILPDVSYGWSGFFAEKQQFFPSDWIEHAVSQTTVNRPQTFELFTRSVRDSEKPGLNFIHFLYPHVPYAYLPDGRNYGNHWLRGLEKDQWLDSRWGILNGRQRHFLQLQHFDNLLGGLIDHMQALGLFEKSLFVLVADHGVAFRTNDKRRVLSDSNIVDILHVPLFIKAPRQVRAEIIDAPVMTVDILPTVLGILGYDGTEREYDGIDLGTNNVRADRERLALSFRRREYRQVNSNSDNIGESAMINRNRLQLDVPDRAVWGIGPLADYRGQSLEELCPGGAAATEHVADSDKPLPGIGTEQYLPAFVSGRFRGNLNADKAYLFVITADNIIAASGETWQLRGNHLYFAMVEPDDITVEDRSLQPWLITPETCPGFVAGAETKTTGASENAQ
jgi:hypothetical protein